MWLNNNKNLLKLVHEQQENTSAKLLERQSIVITIFRSFNSTEQQVINRLISQQQAQWSDIIKKEKLYSSSSLSSKSNKAITLKKEY